ncbi:MAG: sigma-70 family RNA polymerase sigma factor [Eubacteriales bacterium]|nr:sigma-70 family RNA polymerase sigma factor [Eubacteriales bacterium]
MDNRLSTLIVNAASGDQTAFHEIVNAFEPLIESIIKKYNNRSSEYDEDDLRQEAAIALFGAVRTYKSGQNDVTFGLYAKICIKNRIISQMRKASVTVQQPEEIDFDKKLSSEEYNPENELIDKENYMSLLNLLDKNLSNYEKTVFKLYILNISYNEIAANLGTSQKSVDNAIYRIKNKIKKLI